MPKQSNPLPRISKEKEKHFDQKSKMIAAKLKLHRESKRISLREFAPAIGLTEASSIMRIEDGTIKLTFATYFAYCEALELEPISTLIKFLTVE